MILPNYRWINFFWEHLNCAGLSYAVWQVRCIKNVFQIPNNIFQFIAGLIRTQPHCTGGRSVHTNLLTVVTSGGSWEKSESESVTSLSYLTLASSCTVGLSVWWKNTPGKNTEESPFLLQGHLPTPEIGPAVSCISGRSLTHTSHRWKKYGRSWRKAFQFFYLYMVCTF